MLVFDQKVQIILASIYYLYDNNKPHTMQKTFIFLVGINDYPSPISTLRGCLKDLDQVETYLKTNIATAPLQTSSIDGLPIQQFGNLQICRLENEQATYNNISKGFTKFLQQASEKDAVWFHFSGHGAEQPTAPEFLPIEPNGKDQTLVCYQQTSSDLLHLADKELAVLLHQVANFDLTGKVKKSPHIIVTLDCCHSGSGTRDLVENCQLKSRNLYATGTSRLSLSNESTRSLATYANGFYSQQFVQKNKVAIPLAKHILLSACESVQVAGDLPTGGIFTTSLITALSNAKGPLNYADLFIKTRAAVQKNKPNQLPQCEPLGNFNPYTRFLNGAVLGTPNRFEIIQKDQKWWVKCGTIHGLSLHAHPINIHTSDANAPKIGVGKLVTVGGLNSEFEWIEGEATENAANYRAVIPTFIDAPILVGLTGDATALAKLKAVWEDTTSIQWTEDMAAQADWVLEVSAKDGQYFIHNRRRNSLALNWPQSKESAAAFIMDALTKIAKWERMLTLNKANSKITDWVDFELGIMDKNQQTTYYKNSKIVIEATNQNCFEKNGALVLGFLPQVKIKHTRRNIYCYLFHLRTNYSIQSEEGAVIYRPTEHTGTPTLPLVKKTKAWGLAAEDTEVKAWFKLIVTTAPLDHQQFIQSDLLGDRAVHIREQLTTVRNEWYSRDIQVIMNKKIIA